jgi:hypothetical protein
VAPVAYGRTPRDQAVVRKRKIMKAKHMDTRVGDLVFKNGQSALVVFRGDLIHDYVDWPGRPKQRPTTQDEMDQAIEDWFEYWERQPTAMAKQMTMRRS